MAKVILSPEFESMSGKLCRRHAVTISLNKKTGKMVRYDSHPGVQPNSAAQKAVKTAFVTRSSVARTWWNANKPIVAKDGTVTREGTEDYKKFKKLYDAQKKIGNPFGYLLSRVTPQNTINLGDTTTSGGTTQGGGNEDRNEVEY